MTQINNALFTLQEVINRINDVLVKEDSLNLH
jgi:hypothetical protein